MLDSETPLGSLFIAGQKRVQTYLENQGYVVVGTSTKVSESDIILGKRIDGELRICGVAEIKTRISAGDQPLTLEYLKKNGGYLITYEKIRYGAQLSVMLKTPFFVIVSLVAESKILIWKITDDNGEYLEEIKTKMTQTRKTVNGGVAIRKNAFLPIETPNLTIINEGSSG